MARRTPIRIAAVRKYMALAMLAGLAACSWSDDQTWHGYYYENTLVKTPAEMSVAYASADQCLAGMKTYMNTAPRYAGFACARGCPAEIDGYLADCQQVVR